MNQTLINLAFIFVELKMLMIGWFFFAYKGCHRRNFAADTLLDFILLMCRFVNY